MKNLILISLFTLASNVFFAQTLKTETPIKKEGFAIGLGIGAGLLAMESNDIHSTHFSFSIPNIKLGYFINEKSALWLYLPGSTFSENDNDRGFEGIVLAGQYWIGEKWWIKAGAGMTFDAPAFYEVENINNADFSIGFPALTSGIGYDLFRKGKFSLDIQYRVFYGRSKLDNNITRQGISNMIILGFNWY